MISSTLTSVIKLTFQPDCQSSVNKKDNKLHSQSMSFMRINYWSGLTASLKSWNMKKAERD